MWITECEWCGCQVIMQTNGVSSEDLDAADLAVLCTDCYAELEREHGVQLDTLPHIAPAPATPDDDSVGGSDEKTA